MSDERRAILEDVASGRMTPAEAAARFDDVEREAHPSADAAPTGLRGVRVRSEFGRIVVLGDATVDLATADGPHVARREGDVLVIEREQRFESDFRFGSRNVGAWWNTLREQVLTVRMNPRLEVWISTEAGSVAVRGLSAPIHAEVQAGSLDVQGFDGPVDLAASAGSIRAQGRLLAGTSTIRCEVGSIRLELASGSDVRVTASTAMGKVSLEQGLEVRGKDRALGQQKQAVYGAGTASLAIHSQMGTVTVRRTP
jgi:hypothetical protein